MPQINFHRTPERPRAHRLGDVGQTIVSLVFKRWGWTADLVGSDYGEDLDCAVFLERRRTALHFRCQVKALRSEAASMVRRLKAGGFGVRVSSSTATAWALSYFPVLLTIYDESTGRIAWTNATIHARSVLGTRTGKTLTFHVPDNDLESEQSSLLASLRDHYARLLQLDAAELSCEVYPLLMPGYRALPITACLDLTPGRVEAQGLNPSPTTLSLDAAPAWATSINTLDGPYLRGWNVRANGESIDSFIQRVQSLLGAAPADPTGNWRAFIRSPVRFSSADKTEYEVPFWSGDLTGWGCYSCLGGKVVNDAEHAFAIPSGFLRCIARRARSWEGEWSVAPHLDLAVQLYASAPTTPGYRARNQTQRKHAEGQFVVWMCARNELDVLRDMLLGVGLVFREIANASPGDENIVGAIADPMFEPAIGLIPQALDWDEYERGSVRVKLERAGLLHALPGKEGSLAHRNEVMDIFGPSFGTAPTELLTAERMFIPGLPLDHSKRLTIFQRFRKQGSIDFASLSAAVERLVYNLPRDLRSLPGQELTCSEIDGMLGPIVEVAFSWCPPVESGALEALEEYASTIASTFDQVLPRLQATDFDNRDTLDVLKFEGELYFEGDDPWGFRSRREPVATHKA